MAGEKTLKKKSDTMGTDFSRHVKIYFDEDHEPEETIAEVQRLVAEGYTSGIDPNWEIVEDEDTDEKEEYYGPK